MRTILHGMECHRDLIAHLDRIPAPAARRELARPAHFKGPFLWLAGGLHCRDMNPGMGIDPLEGLDGTVQALDLVVGEHGEGMMRRGGKARAYQGASGEQG